jgi:molybdopterin/thiamine biosynthesis adenylyltransferase
VRWWEVRKHVLVREKSRIDSEFPNNDFSFRIKGNSLWITGTLLNFFEFECKYSDSYPFSPPDIYPKDRSTKWVLKHQFVKDGRFCLNIREKTWNSSLSAADIIKSLETLLVAEDIRKITKEDKLIVYEEDEPTKLQKMFKKILCVVPTDIQFPPDKSFGILRYFYLVKHDTYRVVITSVMHGEKQIESSLAKMIWKAESFSSEYRGLWIRTSLDIIVEILLIPEFDKLNQFLSDKGIIPNEKSLNDFIGKSSYIHLLLFDQKYPGHYFYLACNVEKNKNEPYGTYLMNSKEIFDRIPNKGNYEILSNRKVTIIGCGSGGSKVAKYLAKAGVGKFVLIDDDILTSQNVIRHACQLDDIGFEKVYAVKDKLQKVNPEVLVEPIVKRAYVIDSFLEEKIKDSNIIIVATASNEEIFNEYAYNLGIPAIYSKVYPLGFGGEVLRIIPTVTPCFECAHYLKENLITEQFKDAIFPDSGTVSYDQTHDGQQIPLPALAVDADFIALITSKMALEVLTAGDYEIFKDVPNVILWGNRKEWIFDQDYQCLKFGNRNLKSLENCIVCHGDEVIEKELGKTRRQIEEEYEEILSNLSRENGESNPN